MVTTNLTLKHRKIRNQTCRKKKGGGILDLIKSFLQYTENYREFFDSISNPTNLDIYFPTQFDHKILRAKKLITKNITKVKKIDIIDSFNTDNIKETLKGKLERYFSYYKHTILLEECELELTETGEKITGSKFTNDIFLRDISTRYEGKPATIRCYCGLIYKDESSSKNIKIFDGELKCTINSPANNNEDKYGWDSLLVPNGYNKSILHLKDESYKVDVRNLPYSQIQALLAPFFKGLFETHITISFDDVDMTTSNESILSNLHTKWELFAQACQEFETQLRPLCIFEQGAGDNLEYPQIQFQTARYNVFRSADLAIQNAIKTKHFFEEKGFHIARTRVEAMASNELVPLKNSNIITKKNIGSSLENKYFETHLRINITHPVTITSTVEMDKINTVKEIVEKHVIDKVFEPHISFNGTKGFLNARGFKIGNDTYSKYWNSLRDEIFTIPNVQISDKSEHREYAIYDDDITFDERPDASCVVPQITWITAAIKGGL